MEDTMEPSAKKQTCSRFRGVFDYEKKEYRITRGIIKELIGPRESEREREREREIASEFKSR